MSPTAAQRCRGRVRACPLPSGTGPHQLADTGRARARAGRSDQAGRAGCHRVKHTQPGPRLDYPAISRRSLRLVSPPPRKGTAALCYVPISWSRSSEQGQLNCERRLSCGRLGRHANARRGSARGSRRQSSLGTCPGTRGRSSGVSVRPGRCAPRFGSRAVCARDQRGRAQPGLTSPPRGRCALSRMALSSDAPGRIRTSDHRLRRPPLIH